MEKFNKSGKEKIESYSGILSDIGVDYSKLLYESLIDEVIDEGSDDIDYEKILFEEEWEEIFFLYYKYNVKFPETSIQGLWDAVVKVDDKNKRESLKKIDLFMQKYNYLVFYMIGDEISRENRIEMRAVKILRFMEDMAKKMREKKRKVLQEKILNGEFFKDIMKEQKNKEQENKKNKK